MKKEWSNVALTELATLRRREVTVEEDGVYPEVGVRCFGKGLFHKAPRSGLEVGDKKLFRLQRADLIIQVTFAWEGAVALVSPEDESFFGSVRVLTLEVNPEKCEGRFLLWYFRTKQGVEQLARISPGSAGRNRVLAIGRLGEIVVPLPPLPEQQRLVTHLEAIEARLTRAQKLREELNWEIEAFTTSLHLAMADGRVVRLSQLLQLDEEQVEVSADGSYPQIGIRSFGLGLFTKPAISGSDTTYRAFNVLRPGMFVMSQVKGWEGALGVADEALNGWFASPEYRTFTCINGECDSRYLSHLASTTWFRKQLASATRGVGARRERVRPEMLLGLEIPFPECARQTKAAEMLGNLKARKALSVQAETRKAALMPSLLDRVFNSQARMAKSTNVPDIHCSL